MTFTKNGAFYFRTYLELVKSSASDNNNNKEQLILLSPMHLPSFVSVRVMLWRSSPSS